MVTSRELIDEILALVDNPPAPEGDILPEYALVFEEGFLEGVSRSLKIITKHENEKQKEAEQIKGFIERTGLKLSEWQIDYLTRQLQKRPDGQVH